ncbi:hypothetical protein P7F88_21430 [Vibrio hannami]|uniref:hypothetical protein n=1 Tax=Vibrio hannami TaxID=2717094 RepID=UPI00240F2D9B|nr:hypothetical protein [Vibrio hannami]MDG3088484.1 hypothetical protein [Vibrio hannami]
MNASITDTQSNGREQRTRNRGRFILMALIMLFALPAIIAKVILVQDWYQSGVTNKGELIEPRLTYSDLEISIPSQVEHNWHLGFVLPEHCDTFCQRQLHILKQSHVALGKYQPRVSPVVLVTNSSDKAVDTSGLTTIEVNTELLNKVSTSEYLITDPLGQLVMKYPAINSENELQAQSKDLLSDLRKLLKLSRVG